MNLINAILQQPQSPCEVFSCKNRARCEKELACSSFFDYVETGQVNKPTEPNGDTYRLIFEERENERLFP